MGIGTLGFLSGASKTALSSIEAREENDRKKKLAEDLEKLRREGEKIARDDAKAEKAKEVDDKLSTADYEKGVVTLRNSQGTVIGERPLTSAEREDRSYTSRKRALDLEGDEVSILNTRDTIRSRAADDARQGRVAEAQIGSYNRANRPTTAGLDGANEGMGDDEFTIGRELLDMRKGMVESLKARNIDPMLIDEAAAAAVREAMTNPNNKTKQDRIRAALAKLDTRLNSLRIPQKGLENYYQVPKQR